MVYGFADLDGFRRESRACGFKNAQRGAHDFGTDAIAVGDSDGNVAYIRGAWSWRCLRDEAPRAQAS